MMIRNLKSLGLAFAAVLAMSAVAASAAQAVPQFTGSSYPTGVTGWNFKGGETFTTEAGAIQCDTHYLSAFNFNASSTLELFPTYENCTAFGFLSATVNPEGCEYLLHATELVSAGVYNHHFDIRCLFGESIKITAGTCKAEVKGQNGLTTVKTTNSGGSVTVQPNVTNIAMTVTQDGFACPFNGTGAKTGSYHGDVVFSRFGGGSFSVSGS